MQIPSILDEGEPKTRRSAKPLPGTAEILNMLEIKRLKFDDKVMLRISLKCSRAEHLLPKIFISGKGPRNGTHNFSAFDVEVVRKKDRPICFVASGSCVLYFHLDTLECSHEQTEYSVAFEVMS